MANKDPSPPPPSHPPHTPISIRNYPNYAILPGITRFHTDKSWAPGVANKS